MTEDYDIDLAVIGSGGAAMSAAIAASQAGKSVVLIERGVLGGTCVNIGCVPSKTLLAAAGARHAAITNPFTGAPTAAGRVNLGDLVAQKDALIERLRDAKYADVAAAYGFEVRPRSEERRVGKECISRWAADHERKNAERQAEIP